MSDINDNAITSILSIVLVCMVFLLMVLLIWYLVLKMKINRENKKKSPQEIKVASVGENNKKKGKKSSVSKNYNVQPMSDFMEFDKVEDNMIIQKDGKRYLMVVQCQGVNYDLMSQVEKVSVEEGFQQFLNTLRHPIQIYIQTRTINLESSIHTYEDEVKKIEDKYNSMRYEYQRMIDSHAYTKEDLDKYFYELTKQKNLYEYGKDIVYNTEKMNLNRNILNKQYYIILSYYLEENPDDHYNNEEIMGMAFSELYTKAQALIGALASCSVTGKILDSNELIDLLYVAYNRDEAEVFGINRALQAGYDELYSTAPDVFEKKIRALDKEIEDKAIQLANEKIDKVQTIAQQRAMEKEDNIDELINKMAELILTENKEYVGEEVANLAIQDIKQDRENAKEKSKTEKKGGKVNESVQKARSTRKN